MRVQRGLTTMTRGWTGVAVFVACVVLVLVALAAKDSFALELARAVDFSGVAS